LNLKFAVTCKAYPGISKGPDLQLINPCGLSDPLIARLPARQDQTRKMGYFERELPLGYTESVRSGQNVLVDEATRNYYEYIQVHNTRTAFILGSIKGHHASEFQSDPQTQSVFISIWIVFTSDRQR
jgi:hypothetical protein